MFVAVPMQRRPVSVTFVAEAAARLDPGRVGGQYRRMQLAGRAESRWLGFQGAAAALGVGLALGVASRYWDRLDSQFAWVMNIGGPWLAFAFIFGAASRRTRAGAEGGAALLVIAVGVYYLLGPTFHAAHEVDAAVRLTILWGAIGAVGGAVMGWAGAAWRTGSSATRALAVALFSGALLGEGVLLFVRPGRDGAKIFFLEIAAGALLPWILLRTKDERFRSILMTAGFGLVAVASVVLVRTAAHASFIIFPPR